MSKNEFLKVLIPKLKQLHEEDHLRDLVRNGWYDEAQAVIDEINYSALDALCDYGLSQENKVEVSDIPKEYLVTFTFYLCGSRFYSEADIMRDWKELQAAVAKQGEDGAIIAEKMNDYYLNDFSTIAELLEPYEEEEDAVD